MERQESVHSLSKTSEQIVGTLERSAKSPEKVTELQYLLPCCIDSFQSSKGSLELALAITG